MRSKIQQVFDFGWADYSSSYKPSDVQRKAAHSIMFCKSGAFGYNLSSCPDCGHIQIHSNSCRNRNCPNCQAILKEIWIDKRKSEVIDAPYFHVVFTVPAQLNSLIYSNQKLLYSLLHKASAETLLELSQNPKYLGAMPGIIQVLHTWGQELNFHPHIHCIVSGAGLSSDLKLKYCGKNFFIPAKVLAAKFRGKFLSHLNVLFKTGKLSFSKSCAGLKNLYSWKEFIDELYAIEWCPHVKETFNGFGNAIEYLGRYTHRVAITNTRVKSVSKSHVTFLAKDYKNNSLSKEVTLQNKEFIRRLMMHVLPPGFQKIRYYGFLNNRSKKKCLRIIFDLQGHRQFCSALSGLSMADILKKVWNYDICTCPVCGSLKMHSVLRTFNMRC